MADSSEALTEKWLNAAQEFERLSEEMLKSVPMDGDADPLVTNCLAEQRQNAERRRLALRGFADEMVRRPVGGDHAAAQRAIAAEMSAGAMQAHYALQKAGVAVYRSLMASAEAVGRKDLAAHCAETVWEKDAAASCLKSGAFEATPMMETPRAETLGTSTEVVRPMGLPTPRGIEFFRRGNTVDVVISLPLNPKREPATARLLSRAWTRLAEAITENKLRKRTPAEAATPKERPAPRRAKVAEAPAPARANVGSGAWWQF